MQKHPLADCDKCPLSDEKYVPSEIPDNPRLVVVGEAPGFQEAVRGRPFTGPSGQLLDRVLKHHGYPRHQVAYTNVVSCRPQNNATPPKSAITACRGRLMGELGLVGVRDIVALGGTAASALVEDSRAITNLRVGPPKAATRGLSTIPGARVVATWHPAYCLRTPDAFPSLVTDIGKLTRRDVDVWTPPTWRYFDDPADARRAIGELARTADRLVVDIEVGIDKDVSFGHPNEYDLLCVGLAYAKGKAVVLGSGALADRTVLDDLGQLLRQTRIIAHNGKFDLAGLFPTLGPLELWFDTMLASYALDERPGQHGLKVLAVERLGAPKYDDEIFQFIPKGGNYADIPREVLYRYNAFDVACTWDLYELFEPELEAQDLRRVHDYMVAASNQLMYLEMNGIKIDKEYSRKLDGEYLQRLEELEQELGTYVSAATNGEVDFLNPRSPQQIKRFLARCGINVGSTDVDHLTPLLARLAPGPVQDFVSGLLRHRREQKLYGTYVKGIRKRLYRGRVYTTYMLHGSTSGRLASRNPNLQNIVRSKEIRRQFTVAKPGHVLIQADYKQAEGRIIATMAQDEYLRRVLSDPEIDIFDDMSDLLYGPGNWRKEVERIRTKAYFYGLSYGREAFSIAMEYKIPVAEAERRLREFRDLIPATSRWQQMVRQQVLDGEDLVTPFGRKRRFWLITKENKKDVLNEALSFLPQSTASDICLGSLVHLRPMLRGMGWIRLTIHDALVVECPESRIDQVSELLRQAMVSEAAKYTDYVPFPVDISIGTTWGDL